MLNALYHQGLDALRRGDGEAAVEALAPVAKESPDTYPDAEASLEEALRAVGPSVSPAPAATWQTQGRTLQTGVQRTVIRVARPATGARGPDRAPALEWALAGRSGRLPLPTSAVRWLGQARAREEALRRRLAEAVPPAVSSQVVLAHGQLGTLASRTGVPAWGLVTLVAVLILAGVFVARGGLVGTRGATPTAAAPVPTQVPDADLFARCDDAVAAERWADAIRDCRVARARTPDREGLAPKLAAAYVGRGEQRQGAGDLTAAAGDFEQALAFHPEFSEAQRALQQLTLYQDGDKALVTGAWDVAVARLSVVHAEAPDYLRNLGERSLEGKLFAAWLKWGQSALNAADKPTAAARCAQALALVPDDAEAQTCLDAASAPAESAPSSD